MDKSDQSLLQEIQKLRSSVDSMGSKISEMERKFSRLEASPMKRYLQYWEPDEEEDSLKPKAERKGLESTIGEDGFAWLSSFIIMFLVIFIMVLFQKKVGSLSATVTGLVATGGVFILAWFLRVKFPTQVYRIRMGAFLLLYYVVMRMHFFTDSPVIESRTLAMILLLLPVIAQFVFAWRSQSQFLTSIGLIMLLAGGLLSDSSMVILTAGSVASLIAIGLFIRSGWSGQLMFALVLVYLNHLIWLFGNPVAGHTFQMVSAPQANYVFLFIYGILFSLGSLFFQKKEAPANFVVSVNIWNALLFSGIFLIQITKFYKDDYMLFFTIIALFTMTYSVLLKTQNKNPFIIAFYACISFVAISITIYGYAGLPGSYLWLALQSIFVVSVALWFRLKLIVIVNVFLFAGLLIFYLIQTKPINSIDIVFTLVALITARILFWQKERLTLKNDLLRNFYLISAFCLVPFTLYHAVPKQFVTLSWVGAAALFFGLSFLWKILKYRWMAIGMLILAIFYLFLFDLKTMDVGFRVVALLIVAAITLGGSLYYTNSRRRRSISEEEDR
jgi:hypothetical protein